MVLSGRLIFRTWEFDVGDTSLRDCTLGAIRSAITVHVASSTLPIILFAKMHPCTYSKGCEACKGPRGRSVGVTRFGGVLVPKPFGCEQSFSVP